MVYNETLGNPTFHAGDEVTVIRNSEMTFNWAPEMDRLCGTQTTIIQAVWDDTFNCYIYKISANTRYNFDASCFMLTSDIETKKNPMFKVGDLVIVHNVKRCRFGWVNNMLEYEGNTYKIDTVYWSGAHNCYVYRFENGGYSWSYNCLSLISGNDTDFTVDNSLIDNFLQDFVDRSKQ